MKNTNQPSTTLEPICSESHILDSEKKSMLEEVHVSATVMIVECFDTAEEFFVTLKHIDKYLKINVITGRMI